MFIDIESIRVNDRIRRDFGDLEELAEDIKANTLLNAIVVFPNDDDTYTLVAGERRLRAMRDILGYRQVAVNVVSVRDAEQALMMEISENECRKEFSKTERLEYARRLAQIEGAKAKERQGTRTDIRADLRESARTDETVADTLGTSATQLRREQFISDNADLLDPADFADWDEGRLSTNKAFQRIKAAKQQAERALADARANEQTARRVGETLKRQRDEALEDVQAYKEDVRELQAEVSELERQYDELQAQKVQVVERDVVREVVPDDYEQVKHRVRELEDRDRMRSDDNRSLREQLDAANRELSKAKNILGMSESSRDVRRDVQYLISATNSYIRQYGGLTWTVQQLELVDGQARDELTVAARNLVTFSSALVASLEQMR